jgi:hypothetical protein
MRAGALVPAVSGHHRQYGRALQRIEQGRNAFLDRWVGIAKIA